MGVWGLGTYTHPGKAKAWRLLQNSYSLCSHVLAAKYFPHGSMLNATPKQGISYVWRSILKGINLLKIGFIWRVGNGENISIWSDPLIPRGSSRKIKVSELINPITNQWDMELLRQHFWPEDVDIILQIPVQEDTEEEKSSFYWKKLWTLSLSQGVAFLMYSSNLQPTPKNEALQERYSY